MMDREEILLKSRLENKFQDEMMADILKKAGKLSSEIGMIVACLIFGIEAFFFNSFNFGILGVYFAIEGTKELVKYSKLKEKKQLIMGLIICTVSIMILVGHFMKMSY